MEIVQEIFGWAGAGIAVLSFLFPAFPYINVLRGKLDFESTPAVLVTTCYFNYFCWFVYGYLTFSNQIKYCYLTGSIINIILMAIYLIFEFRKYLVDTILNILILIASTWAIFKVLRFLIYDYRIVGKICMGTSFIVFFSQIQIIYKVIKEKNYILVPIYNCYLIFLYAICWAVYGIFINDFYIVFTNAIAIVLALVEIIVYLNYKRKYTTIGEREIAPTIGIETSTIETSTIEEAS